LTPDGKVEEEKPKDAGAAAEKAVPRITVTLILETQTPQPKRELLPQSNIIEGLKTLAESAKSELQPSKMAKLSESISKLVALDMNVAATAGNT